MAQPNIVNVTDIKGETRGYSITTTLTNTLVNSSGSNSVIKANTILISNIDSANAADISVSFYDNQTTDVYLARTVTVPAKSTLDLLNKPVYLEENDSFRMLASADSDLEAVISYEIITDA